MALDFSTNGYENLFRQALTNGINLFCGAGFSVEAMDRSGRTLPVGAALLKELQEEFPAIKPYKNLPRACTKLLQTDKGSFYTFLETRFAVDAFSDLYKALLDINIKNIYTTNIDDLFFKLYETSDRMSYLVNRSLRGSEYIPATESEHRNQVNYFPLHGCIRAPKEYVFGATEIASAFSQKSSQNSWGSLASDAEKNAILFWGWNFEDSGPIEAMYGGQRHVDDNIKKWALLYNPDEETVDFLLSLNFNIIKGNTTDMLQYLLEFGSEQGSFETSLELDEAANAEFKRYAPPTENDEGSYPLKSFFCDYTPRWSYIYSKSIPQLGYFRQIADLIAANKNVVFTGIRGAGKTTLLMQLVVNIETPHPKHYMLAPTLEQAESYLKSLKNAQSMLFIDDCFRDTDAIIKLLDAGNVQVICCDRDFNYERQYHKIQNLNFATKDITELTEQDAQAIINIIPMDLKRKNVSTKKFKKDPTLPNLLVTTLKPSNFKFMQSFYENDPMAAKVFLMICYVHSCGVPCSFDMVYSFLGDRQYTWQQMMNIVHNAGKLIKDCANSSDYFGSFDIDFSLQDYYQCRSRLFAEKIIESIPKGNQLFASVLSDFVNSVPPFKICAYDKFKRSGYDADLACRAFTSFSDGKEFYEACILSDESEYIYQQAAIYFSRIGNLKEAFLWIDRARNLAHYNRFSIDSTYAMIYFNANVGIEYTQCKEALRILSVCCTSDKRKAIHFSTYSKCVLKYAEMHWSDDAESILDYIDTALTFIAEGLDDKNISLQTKNKWELKDLKKKLEEAKKRYFA